MDFRYIELIFENVTSVDILREDIIEFSMKNIVLDEMSDKVVFDFRLKIANSGEEVEFSLPYLKTDKSKFEYIQSMNIASYILHYDDYEEVYFVEYDNEGYLGGDNINQKITRDDEGLLIVIRVENS